jgi:hypothetical protein
MSIRRDPTQSQFEKADRAVLRAASAIEKAVADLLATTLPLEHVASDYVIERLVDMLIERNHQAMDRLNQRRGEATMILSNALMDWRDKGVDR